MQSKFYKVVELYRDGTSFLPHESGNYKVVRERIKLPERMVQDFNDNWKNAGKYYIEIQDDVDAVVDYSKYTYNMLKEAVKEKRIEIKGSIKKEELLTLLTEK
jgi:hypothetical protein